MGKERLKMTREKALQAAKPILFNTEMVRAIQNGTKTVTRRIIKPKYTNTEIILKNGKAFETLGTPITTVEIKLPYQVGDILYVRETWYYEESWHDLTAGEPDLPSGRYSHRYVYRADNPNYLVDVGVGIHGWKPSIHMPKEAARIFLRVTGVRVERLQDITEKQAIAESAEPFMITADVDKPDEEKCWKEMLPALSMFPSLWNGTVKKSDLDKYGWEANPPVLVVTFERVEVSE